MRARHFLHDEGKDHHLTTQIGRLTKAKFLAAPFWLGKGAGQWRQSHVMGSVEQVEAWHDEEGHHSFSEEANTIERRSAEEVLRVLRNALAHGNIIYLDKDDRETAGQRMVSMAFLSRYEESEKDPKQATTYRVVVTTEDEFLRFIKAWAGWVSGFPIDQTILEAA